MIILEGADNTGKSTLGLQLSKALNVPLRHSETPNPQWEPRECLAHSMKQLLPQRVILDRIYAITESVYGPIIRGKSALGELAKESLMDLYHRPHLIIYCRPHMDDILRNGDRDQMPGVLENHKAIVAAYDRLYWDLIRFSKCTVIQYDWKDKFAYSALLEKCESHLGIYDQSTWSAHAMAEGV